MAGVGAKKFWMVEPESEIWVPVQQKQFVGLAMFRNNTMLFNGPNCSGAGVKNFSRLEPEPKIKMPGAGARNLSSAPQPWLHLGERWNIRFQSWGAQKENVNWSSVRAGIAACSYESSSWKRAVRTSKYYQTLRQCCQFRFFETKFVNFGLCFFSFCLNDIWLYWPFLTN